MLNKINKFFNIKLSKEGKKKINDWLIDEFETMYYAQKALDTDESIIDFVNDMLAQENIKLDDLCLCTYKSLKEDKIDIRKEQKEQLENDYFKYCPYCGKCIDFK